MSKEIDEQVTAFLQAAGISYAVRLVGATKRDDWECDEWRVSFKGSRIDFSTEYFTGIGHRETVRGFKAISMPGSQMVKGHWQASKPVAPSAAGVLHSLMMDGRAIDDSFIVWCEDFGYDTDSRKALATYEACCETGRKMQKLFTREQCDALADMLQDY